IPEIPAVRSSIEGGKTLAPQAGEMRPRILVLANQKGGVGKTTTAINLGTALAAVGERVLIVDLDPQGNASTGLGIGRSERKVSAYDVLIGSALIEDAVVPTKVPGSISFPRPWIFSVPSWSLPACRAA